MKISENKKAPNFKLPSTNGSIFELSKIKNKNIILYFYPKDDTPGCTLESRDFSKLNGLILKNNTVVYGISGDSIETHLKFKKKYKLKFDLLSDEKKIVLKKYGVWGKKKFLGKEYMGIIRTTIILKLTEKFTRFGIMFVSKITLKKFLRKLKIFNFTNEKR